VTSSDDANNNENELIEDGEFGSLGVICFHMLKIERCPCLSQPASQPAQANDIQQSAEKTGAIPQDSPWLRSWTP